MTPVTVDSKKDLLGLSLPTLTAEIERLPAARVAFRGDLVTGPGGSQATIEDPSGNPVELFAPAR